MSIHAVLETLVYCEIYGAIAATALFAIYSVYWDYRFKQGGK